MHTDLLHWNVNSFRYNNENDDTHTLCSMSEADPEFSRQGRRDGEGGGEGCWYPWVAQSLWQAHKMLQFENWNLIETVTPEILAMPQTRNYNEMPVQSV